MDSSTRLSNIFFPHALSEITAAQKSGMLFSHYTSLENAELIIKHNCFWLRNATLMNDHSEIKYGMRLTSQILSDSDIFSRLQKILETIQPNLTVEIIETFVTEQNDRINDSYIISLGQHGSKNPRRHGHTNDDEYLYGRLSMWRGYAPKDGVAFILNTSALLGNSNAYNAYMSPCLYATEKLFNEKFTAVLNNMENSIAFLKNQGAKAVKEMLCRALHFAVLSTKHPGFMEEQEWRVIYCPTHSATGGESKNIEASDEIIRGTPQRIYKLRMQNFPELGFTGASFPELLNHMIIGPTQNPQPAYDRLTLALTNAGVKDVCAKIRLSEIPLRSE